MKWRIQNQFVVNYILMIFISIMIGIIALILMDFADDVISKTLVKNNYTAESLMQDDYRSIETTPVLENGGGVQVISSDHEIVFSSGLNTFTKDKLSKAEFTDFLIDSKSIGTPYSYDIAHNPQQNFWLLVTFPTSLRIDFAIVHNEDFASVDMQNVAGVITAIVLFYLILVAISTIVYSKITSISIVNPLRKLALSAKKLRDGDYSSRVDIHLTNEFAELQDTFNEMAERIEQEISLRKESEEKRKKLVLDISHDLKNPLASAMGYAELCLNKEDLSKEELDTYLKTIHENSVRANNLITDLFELSKMESSEFVIHKDKVDICEYLRERMGRAVSTFDQEGFSYEFDIPEEEIYVMLDVEQMDRVLQNLIDNTVKYNKIGTKITVKAWQQDDDIFIIFKDNGIGIPANAAKDIFNPFVRADASRNSETGGTGLGLAIVEKVIKAHGGTIDLKTDTDQGCEFIICIPQNI